MRTIRIYQTGNYQVGDTLILTPEASQHLGKVLRVQPDERLYLFRGDNSIFKSVVVEVTKKKVSVRIETQEISSLESPLRIHLAQALSKGDRMEWVIQKATELGVTSITPLITQHCAVKLDTERLEKKHHYWQQIIIAACEQCGRNELPILHPFQHLNAYALTDRTGLRLVLSPTAQSSWRHYKMPNQEVNLLIGPEGGLSREEVLLLEQQDFLPLALGPRILRTETAALAALTLLQTMNGDF